MAVNGKRLPLSGVRVLDLTWVVSGPQATRLLADLGAEVIKVEARTRGEQVRNMTFNPRVLSTRGMFVYFNRNKLGASLNLSGPEGKQVFRELTAVSDVVIENFSAHVMERWGFDYAGLTAINPSIIYVSMPGFGHSGPNVDYQSNGPTLQALSGQTFAGGMPGMPPAGWGYSYMDHTAGYYGAMAVLQAIYYRNRTGRGQFVDLAQLETGCSLMGTYVLDRSANGRSFRRPGMPAGNRSLNPAAAPHGVYRCQGDDRWVAIAVLSDAEWLRFSEALGAPVWARNPELTTLAGRLRHQDELDRCVETWTAHHTQQEVMHILQANGIAAGMVQDPAQRAEEDPELQARGHIVRLPVAQEDGSPQRVDSLPMTVPALPHDAYRPAPETGHDNDYVYRELLGMASDDIDAYLEQGIF
ncbi:MAG TPA: CoA transferase [Dehalococcoidia bacterium]|nr:CoA transferase [Dehalococcoidia bacterium]